MTDEKLIDEAARRLDTFLRLRDGTSPHDKDLRIVINAVFEKAHTPTDDDREALAEVIEVLDTHGQWPVDRITDAILAAGFRRSEVPEPSADVFDELAKDVERFRDPEDPEPNAELRDTPRPRKDGEAWCTSKSPLYPGSHGYDRCWGAQGHPEPLHVSASRRWSEPQGEPSDAEINAAALELYGVSATYDPERVASALRAAREVNPSVGEKPL